MRVAAVKIGSTTVSYLVAETLHRPLLRRSHVLNLLVRSDGPQVLVTLVKQWLNEEEACPDRLLMAGGQALREQPAFSRALGHMGWILDGQQEGQLTRMGVLASTGHAPGMLIDIGGGSTEIVDDTGSHSLPIGVHRVHVVDARWPVVGPATSATVVGGAGHAVVHLLQRRAMESVSRGELHALQQTLSQGGAAWIRAHGIPHNRVALVEPGVEILLAVMTHYQLSSFVWTPYGLLEGIWLAASLGRGRRWSFEDLDRMGRL
jgi:hypothetical protein